MLCDHADMMKRNENEIGFVEDLERWAEQQFGSCDLGDVRRTLRLVHYASRQAAQPQASTHVVCAGDDAIAEGTYRWIRNSAIDPKAVEEGPFQATAQACKDRELVLAIQDTTTLTFSHAVADELGSIGEIGGHEVAGILVHSTLMLDAQSRAPLGLIDQQRWCRPFAAAASKPRRQKVVQPSPKRRYQDKESAKWEQSTERMCSRLGDTSNVVTVCDREADIFDYIIYLLDHNQRFVIRAAQDRCLLTRKGRLFEVMAKQPVVSSRAVQISQRGVQRATPNHKQREGRSARTASMSVRVANVELARPMNRHDGPESVSVEVVYLRERNAPKGAEPAEWFLFTTEPVANRAQIEKVIEYYECRWLIEEFHMAWKTGCRIEQRRVQTLGNLERLVAVTAPIAVRILQIRALARSNPTKPCNVVLSPADWQCLFTKVNSNKPLPNCPPTIDWAFTAIAKLGGWRDTKRTGQVGWQALWRGWAKLQDLVEGWNLAQKQS